MTQQQENAFIRRLWITLASVIGPFIIMGSINAVMDHTRIKNNSAQIEAMKDVVVSKDVLILYVDELRRMNAALETEQREEYQHLNDRMDKLVEDLYTVRTRGTKTNGSAP